MITDAHSLAVIDQRADDVKGEATSAVLPSTLLERQVTGLQRGAAYRERTGIVVASHAGTVVSSGV